jgi:hypothetical protein
MKIRVIVVAAALSLPTAALAGPCTARIAELEKSMTAKQEGAGPSLAPSASTTGSTNTASGSSGPPSANVTAESRSANATMETLQQAKRLDQEGKEAECMQLLTQAGATAPVQPK